MLLEILVVEPFTHGFLSRALSIYILYLTDFITNILLYNFLTFGCTLLIHYARFHSVFDAKSKKYPWIQNIPHNHIMDFILLFVLKAHSKIPIHQINESSIKSVHCKR